MSAPIHAYVCASRSSAVLKGPYPVGSTARSSKGVIVARELDDALREHDAWPITLHEVEVAPDQVLDADERYVKVRSFRVLRDLPLSEAFGARADELVALFGELRRSPWLAPRAAADAERVTDLIRSRYTALGAYARVEALPCRIVTTWADAMRADNDALHRERIPAHSDDAMGAALDAVRESPTFEARAHAICKAQIVPFHLAYQAMWEAAWEAAAAAMLASAIRTGTADARIRVRAMGRIRDKLDASRDRCRRAAWQAILAVRAHEEDPDQPANQPTMKSLAARSDEELVPVWTTAWNFADAAATTVARAAKHLVALPDEPNPWLPLVELFRMGAWPIDEVDRAFVVFFRAPPS
jgi:hypothetical protein